MRRFVRTPSACSPRLFFIVYQGWQSLLAQGIPAFLMNIPGFYAVQLFQMFGWALMTVSSVFYINAIMAPEDSVKGQACFTMSMTLGNVVGAIAAGRILDALGVQAMLAFGTASALAGAVIVLIFAQRTEE